MITIVKGKAEPMLPILEAEAGLQLLGKGLARAKPVSRHQS